MKKDQYYVYLYTTENDSKVEYVGQTKREIEKRIKEHENEPKFAQYFKHREFKIRYLTLQSAQDMDICEKYLIKTYLPTLNKKDCFTSGSLPPVSLDIKSLSLFYPQEHIKTQLTREEKSVTKAANPEQRVFEFMQLHMLSAPFAEPKQRIWWAYHQYCCFIKKKLGVSRDKFFELLETFGWSESHGFITRCMLQSTYPGQNNRYNPERDELKCQAWIDAFVKATRTDSYISAYQLKHDMEYDIGIYLTEDQMTKQLDGFGFSKKRDKSRASPRYLYQVIPLRTRETVRKERIRAENARKYQLLWR